MRSLNSLKSRSINNDTLSKTRVAFALNQTATTGASLGGGGGGTSNVDLTAVTTNILPTTNSSLNIGSSGNRFGTTFTNDVNLNGNIIQVGNLVAQIGDPTHCLETSMSITSVAVPIPSQLAGQYFQLEPMVVFLYHPVLQSVVFPQERFGLTALRHSQPIYLHPMLWATGT